MTVSPTPAPRRSATTTMLRVGSLSNSIGCTIRNRTPSRSGDFFVDQTVPTTLARNIGSVQFSDFGKDFGRFAKVARRGGDDRARVDVNLLALLDGAAHVVFGDELDGLTSVRGCAAVAGPFGSARGWRGLRRAAGARGRRLRARVGRRRARGWRRLTRAARG